MLRPAVGPWDLSLLCCLCKCIRINNIIWFSTTCPLFLLYSVFCNDASYFLSCSKFLLILAYHWKRHLPVLSIQFIPRRSSKNSWLRNGSLVQKFQFHLTVTEIPTSCRTYQIPRSPRYFGMIYHLLGHSVCCLYCTSTPKPVTALCSGLLSWTGINIHQYLKHFSTIMLLNNFKLLDSAQIGTS